MIDSARLCLSNYTGARRLNAATKCVSTRTSDARLLGIERRKSGAARRVAVCPYRVARNGADAQISFGTNFAESARIQTAPLTAPPDASREQAARAQTNRPSKPIGRRRPIDRCARRAAPEINLGGGGSGAQCLSPQSRSISRQRERERDAAAETT